MCINPTEAAAVATTYTLWTISHRTEAWECLGVIVARLAHDMGGWDSFHAFVAAYLSGIPVQHLKLALADHRLREAHLTLENLKH